MERRTSATNKHLWQMLAAGPVMAMSMAAFAAQSSQLSNGLNAYERGRYDQARHLLVPLAEKGQAEAQFALANMYRQGLGVPQDDSKARRWYRRAADQGVADAQFRLGLIYWEGEGVTEDEYVALEWISQARAQGHEQAAVVFELIVNEDLSLGC